MGQLFHKSALLSSQFFDCESDAERRAGDGQNTPSKFESVLYHGAAFGNLRSRSIGKQFVVLLFQELAVDLIAKLLVAHLGQVEFLSRGLGRCGLFKFLELFYQIGVDDLIADPMYYYDDRAVDGWVEFCEKELTLTDGSDLHMLDSFKLWGEQVFGWYYFETRSVYVPNRDGHGGRYVNKKIKKRLVNKQYLIVGRGAAKSLYDSCIQAYSLVVDGSTTHQITTAPTMKQAEEIINPIKTAITRARGPVFQFLTEGSIQNTTGNLMNRVKLASTKKGIENFISGCRLIQADLLAIRPAKRGSLTEGSASFNF